MNVSPRRERRAVSVSILAGGRSARMGRDKSLLRLGGRTLLGHARALAKELNLPVRVIRRDLVPRCGPLGGIFTALKTSRANAELFLACDMPFVSAELLRRLLAALKTRRAAFTVANGVAGFPFGLRAECLPIVEKQIRAREFSLQSLARVLRAARVSPLRGHRNALLNVNTPQDLTAALEVRCARVIDSRVLPRPAVVARRGRTKRS